jgi:hypothetical protein
MISPLCYLAINPYQEEKMKKGKFDRKWQAVLAGVVLCAVLAVFVTSKVADAQAVSGSNMQQARVMQRSANLNDLWEKMNASEERLVRIEQKIDLLNQEMEVALRVLKRLDKENK